MWKSNRTIYKHIFQELGWNWVGLELATINKNMWNKVINNPFIHGNLRQSTPGFFQLNSRPLLADRLTLPKSNIDTKNDGFWNVSPASNMASFWVSMLGFRGVPSLKLTAKASEKWMVGILSFPFGIGIIYRLISHKKSTFHVGNIYVLVQWILTGIGFHFTLRIRKPLNSGVILRTKTPLRTAGSFTLPLEGHSWSLGKKQINNPQTSFTKFSENFFFGVLRYASWKVMDICSLEG